jgi:excisionase family DNA binding protein
MITKLDVELAVIAAFRSSEVRLIIREEVRAEVAEILRRAEVQVDADAEVSPEEAARLMNLSRDAVYKMLQRKRILAVRRGRRWFVKRADLRVAR